MPYGCSRLIAYNAPTQGVAKMPLVLLGGKLLTENGKLATDLDCCCDCPPCKRTPDLLTATILRATEDNGKCSCWINETIELTKTSDFIWNGSRANACPASSDPLILRLTCLGAGLDPNFQLLLCPDPAETCCEGIGIAESTSCQNRPLRICFNIDFLACCDELEPLGNVFIEINAKC